MLECVNAFSTSRGKSKVTTSEINMKVGSFGLGKSTKWSHTKQV